MDIALPDIHLAIEIYSMFHSATRNRHYERTKCLLNYGWHVLIIWVDKKHHALSENCEQYIAKFAKEISNSPSLLSTQYKVIFGNGNLAPQRKSYFNSSADLEKIGIQNISRS